MQASHPTRHGALASQAAGTHDMIRGEGYSCGLLECMHSPLFSATTYNHEQGSRSRLSHPIRIHACIFSGDEATRLDGPAIAAGDAAGDTQLFSVIDAYQVRPPVTTNAANADLLSKEEARGITVGGTGSHR